MLDFIGKGDTLVVARIDRLTCSIGYLEDTVLTLKVKEGRLQATEHPIDTGTAAGKAFLDVLGVTEETDACVLVGRLKRAQRRLTSPPAAGENYTALESHCTVAAICSSTTSDQYSEGQSEGN